MATPSKLPPVPLLDTSFPEKRILLTVNSQGELYYWVAPFLRTLASYDKAPEVWVFVPPCQFSSGEEACIVSSFPLVTRVFPPKETVKEILIPKAVGRRGRGLVLFFGGDVFTALLLKRKSGFPLWVYGHPPKWARFVDVHLARFQRDYSRSTTKNSFFLGDLLRSVVEEIPPSAGGRRYMFPSGRPRVLFLPGSRPLYYSFLLPLFEKIAAHMRAVHEYASFAVSFPDHVKAASMESISLIAPLIKPFFGCTSRLIEESDCAVAVPGSNNLEIVYREKHGVVILPLDRPEQLPLEGLGGWVEKIPFLGTIVKRNLVLHAERSRRWISLPNLLADQEVLPEVRGKVEPERVVENLEHIMKHPRVENPFRGSEYPAGAARRLSDLVMKYFEGAPLPW